jgi:predicted DCC family thiol-disulfide oxidoreductase YuxK
MVTGHARHLVLYDGACGLCNRLVRFVIAHDPAGIFQFASLQGEHAQPVLASHGREGADLTTFFVLADAHTDNARLLQKSQAALFVLQSLGAPWRLARCLRVLPLSFRDGVYDLVAQHRHRLFGRQDRCSIPSPEVRSRFLDL